MEVNVGVTRRIRMNHPCAAAMRPFSNYSYLLLKSTYMRILTSAENRHTLPLSAQNCPFAWVIWTPSNTSFLGPTRVRNPNGIWIGSAVFVGLTIVTDGPTDRQTTLLRL